MGELIVEAADTLVIAAGSTQRFGPGEYGHSLHGRSADPELWTGRDSFCWGVQDFKESQKRKAKCEAQAGPF